MARHRIQLEITGDSRSVERAFRNAGKAGSGFGRTMKNVGKVAAVGFGTAMLGVGLAMRRGFGELAEAQKVAAQTNAVLRSTGGVANVTAKRVDKLSTSLSRMSGVDDEAVASGANMLLTFTNIRNGVRKTDKIFDMATATVLDMSVALGKDIPTTAIMVGKALNDLTVNSRGTITGWSALRRVGVRISDTMMAQAAAFIKAGRPMEAQRLLLQELNTEFGGSARAFGTTMPGALGKLNNALDEVMAAFATGFLPIIQKVARQLTTKLADPAFVARVRELGTLVGTKLYNAFRAISMWFQENWGGIQAGLNTTANIVRRVHGWFQKIAAIVPGGGETLIGMIAGGLLLSKLGLLNKALGLALRRLGLLAGASAAGPVVAPGGVGGKAGKLGKVARLAGAAALPVAAIVGARNLGNASRAGDKAKWDAMTGAQQRAFMQQRRIPMGVLDQLGFKLKPMRQTPPMRRGDDTPGWVPRTAFTGGASGVGDVYIDGQRAGNIFQRRHQRAAKKTAASRRGPFAGQRLALG